MYNSFFVIDEEKNSFKNEWMKNIHSFIHFLNTYSCIKLKQNVLYYVLYSYYIIHPKYTKALS